MHCDVVTGIFMVTVMCFLCAVSLITLFLTESFVKNPDQGTDLAHASHVQAFVQGLSR